MRFDRDAPNMKAEFGYWAGGVRRWFHEGLPKVDDIPENVLDGDLVRGSSPINQNSSELVDKNVMAHLGLDSYLAKFPFDISPMLRPEILEETEHIKVFRDQYGVVKKVIKESAATHFVVSYPIKNRGDFQRYIEHYDEDAGKRLPGKLEKLKAHLKDRDFPIRLGGGPYGFSFFPRYLMGDVGFMLSMYDDPLLIKEFNDFFLKFVMRYWSLILEQFDIDCVLILEDIAYRGGSMISPQMFNEFLAPYYVRFVDFVKQFGINYIFVDCDGLIDELIPLWVACGVTGIFPVEAVTNIVSVREAFPGLRLMGGVDKTKLFGLNQEKIDAELRRIEPVLKRGGYVPHIDHAVSQDISWESFRYYRKGLNDIIDRMSPTME
jgi:uroporphyrinogen decarboxylase